MQLPVIDAVVKGVLLGLFMAISVGPTLFAVIKYSLEYSYKAGIAFVLGVSVSDIIYVTIANYAANWLKILEQYKMGLAYGGGAILIIAGLVGLVKKGKAPSAESEPVLISGKHYFRIWTSGFLINTVNPGVIISWLTAVTATANTSSMYRLILFGTCLVLVLSIDFLKVFLADTIKKKLTPHLVMMLQKLSSLILMILGLILILTTMYSH